jgi:hypothetical protein
MSLDHKLTNSLRKFLTIRSDFIDKQIFWSCGSEGEMSSSTYEEV